MNQTKDEYEESLFYLKKEKKEVKEKIIKIDPKKINHLEDAFYEEIFGRSLDALDPYENKAIAQLTDNKITGALWYFTLEDKLYIDKLYTTPENRGNSTGSKLIHNLIQKKSTIILDSWEKSIDFYKKIGFLQISGFSDLDDEKFTRMILPYKRNDVLAYTKTNEDLFSNIQDILSNKEFEKYLDAIINPNINYNEPNVNPITMPLYKQLNLEHQLLQN